MEFSRLPTSDVGNQDGNAKCGAKEGEKKDNGNGDDNLQAPQSITDTTMEVELDEDAPGDQAEVDIPIELEDAKSKPSDRRCSTPECAPATCRNAEEEGQVLHPKTRRLSDDAMDTGAENNDASKAMGVEVDTLSPGDLSVLDKSAKGVDIMDIYSPKRVAELAVMFGHVAGPSFDLSNGYDSEGKEDH